MSKKYLIELSKVGFSLLKNLLNEGRLLYEDLNSGNLDPKNLVSDPILEERLKAYEMLENLLERAMKSVETGYKDEELIAILNGSLRKYEAAITPVLSFSNGSYDFEDKCKIDLRIALQAEVAKALGRGQVFRCAYDECGRVFVVSVNHTHNARYCRKAHRNADRKP